MLTPEQARTAPKVLLHDHLDGGLRPSTIIELADAHGYDGLPSRDAQELTAWLQRGADRKDLELYLQTFAHTVAVMQHGDALVRVARECVADLAEDGVVYAEIRLAPELHTEAGCSLDDVVDAVLEGVAHGVRAASAAGSDITVRLLLTAMRTAARSAEIAALALRFRDRGVVGFDIAGAEAGYPPSRHMDAFDLLRRAHFHITVHAGEAFGLESISEALGYCGAERLGHGVRILDDITIADDGTARLGTLAAYVRDRRVPLEMCPSSNVHTGAVRSYREHPIGVLLALRFRVTVNTDNRLMSGVRLSEEFARLGEDHGVDIDDMRWLTVNAAKSAFCHFDERQALIEDVIAPAYASLGATNTRSSTDG